MKIKNLYLILLAVLFIASSCSENPDLNPLLDQTVDTESLNNVRTDSDTDFWDCILNPGTPCISNNGDGSYDNEGTDADIDANSSSTSSGGKPKFNKKELVDCSYWTSYGYTCEDMTAFYSVFARQTSDAEWSIFRTTLTTKAQRSKYVLNARIAIDKANQYFPGFKRNSKGDALRQGIASALNTKSLGAYLTKQLQDAHYTRSLNPYRSLEIHMMQDNEAFGRSLSPQSSVNTLIGQVVYARAYGGLYYLIDLTNYRPTSVSRKVSTRDSSGGPSAGDCPDGPETAGGIGVC